MNQFLFRNGLFSLMLALMMGIMAIYLGFNALKRINHSIDEEFELCNNNIAVALVSGSFIISPGIF
jgi:divalent metal cation (Fe/Co/Zn/Cd) transporter